MGAPRGPASRAPGTRSRAELAAEPRPPGRWEKTTSIPKPRPSARGGPRNGWGQCQGPKGPRLLWGAGCSGEEDSSGHEPSAGKPSVRLPGLHGHHAGARRDPKCQDGPEKCRPTEVAAPGRSSQCRSKALRAEKCRGAAMGTWGDSSSYQDAQSSFPLSLVWVFFNADLAILFGEGATCTAGAPGRCRTRSREPRVTR